VKPSAFDYLAPATVEEALEALAHRADETKLLAGGQTLVEHLNLRRVKPGLLIDLNRIPELSYVEERDGGIAVGAMTRQREVELSAAVERRIPILTEAITHVAHFQIRNRGTIGGSIAHGESGAELPAVLCALDGQITARSLSGGERTVPAAELFEGRWKTSIRPEEIITEVFFPAPQEGTGWAFREFGRRHGDLALGGAAVTIATEGGKITAAAIAPMAGGQTPRRAPRSEAALVGAALGDELGPAVQQSVAGEVEPVGDVHASAEYRTHLTGVMARRAVLEAVEVARG